MNASVCIDLIRKFLSHSMLGTYRVQKSSREMALNGRSNMGGQASTGAPHATEVIETIKAEIEMLNEVVTQTEKAAKSCSGTLNPPFVIGRS